MSVLVEEGKWTNFSISTNIKIFRVGTGIFEIKFIFYVALCIQVNVRILFGQWDKKCKLKRELNPIRAEGAESAWTFFRWLFLHEKRGLDVQNFMTFLNSL